MSKLRMAVVGVGHLGKEHARILAGLPEVELVGVADANAEQAQTVARRLGVPAFTDAWPLLNLVDAASIVVPTSLHASVAGEFLRHGIPLLVEKPLALNLNEAEMLVELADRHGVLLQVGHIERFNPAFEALERSRLQPKFIRAERLGPFTGRATDVGVVLDLMIHDLDLVLTLVQSAVVWVQALGVSVFGQHEDLANARIHFANGCIADLTASRAHPTTGRHMHIFAPEGYAGLDFAQRRLTLMQPKMEVRRHGLDPSKLDPAGRARLKEEWFARTMDVVSIDGHSQDQLTRELQDFVRCVRTGTRPRVNGHDARNALALADRVIQSIQNHVWDTQGKAGPLQVPTPLCPLLSPSADKAAA